MSKNNIIILIITIIILISLTIVGLVILLPQVATGVTNAEEYMNIKKTDYTFTSTKDITEDKLIEEYNITPEQINEGKANKQYIPGNSDPFASQQVSPATKPENSNNNSSAGSTNNTNNSNNAGGNIQNPPPASVEDK